MKSEHFIQFVILLILLFLIVGCGDKMPYYFHGKVLRYPDSMIVNSMRLNGGGYAELETDDSREKVLEYYRDHMSNTGWSIQVERESESPNIDDSNSVIFLALFKDSTGLMIDTYTPVDGGKTQIALFMGDTDE
jgi:hypothetical protein